MRKRWVVVNHTQTECGVWNYGHRTWQLLSASTHFTYEHLCVSHAEQVMCYHAQHADQVCGFLFNWHPVTMNWLSDGFLQSVPGVKVIISGHDHVHEFSQAHHQFVCDPTFTARAKCTPVSRPLNVPYTCEPRATHGTFVVGTCGFGQTQKQFPHLVKKVGEQFDQPVTFRIHMPYGAFVDASGSLAHTIKAECAQACAPHVQLQISHEFMPNYQDLIQWLSENDLNVFSYDHQPGRGCSSALDAAIVSGKPWACNGSNMFRHVLQDWPQLNMDVSDLNQILAWGTQPSAHFLNKWSPRQFIWDHEHILEQLHHAQSR